MRWPAYSAVSQPRSGLSRTFAIALRLIGRETPHFQSLSLTFQSRTLSEGDGWCNRKRLFRILKKLFHAIRIDEQMNRHLSLAFGFDCLSRDPPFSALQQLDFNRLSNSYWLYPLIATYNEHLPAAENVLRIKGYIGAFRFRRCFTGCLNENRP
jgi:hypothetical protein